MDPPLLRKPSPRWLEEVPIEEPGQDALKYGEPAALLARRLRAAHPAGGEDGEPGKSRRSLILTVEGPWGSGKTSFSNLVAHELQDAERPWRSPVVVRFSAWQSVSMRMTPWEALAYRLAEAFYTRFHRLCLDLAANPKEGVSIQVGNPRFKAQDPLLRRDPPEPLLKVHEKELRAAAWFGEARIHWLEVAHRLTQAVAPDDWDPCLKLFADAPSKLTGRPMATGEGLEALVGLIGGGLALSTGDAKRAITAAEAATKRLLGRGLTEGPDWGVDTREFARALDRLLYVLHPKARDWRALVVVDDAARLPEAELPPILEALAYLCELEDVIVVLNLHPRTVAELRRIRVPRGGAAEPAAGSGDGESFLARLVHVRFPIPKPVAADLSRMMADALEQLKIPPVTVVSPVLRHLLSSRDVTPRQMKRALHWLWFRLHPTDDGGAICAERLRTDDPKQLENLLILLLDLHLYAEGRVTGEEIAARTSDRRELLLWFMVQPWDLRSWRDGHGCSLSTWDGFEAALDLLATMRFQDLVFHCGGASIERGLELGQAAWRAWRRELVKRDWLGLTDVIADGTPSELFAHLVDHGGAAKPERLLLAGQIASAARYHHLADDDSLVHGETFSHLARFWYFDWDVLLRVATDPAVDASSAAKAWILLIVVAPQLAAQYANLLSSSLQVNALVPEEATALRDVRARLAGGILLHTEHERHTRQ